VGTGHEAITAQSLAEDCQGTSFVSLFDTELSDLQHCGPGESGKSTILKHMKLIHEGEYSEYLANALIYVATPLRHCQFLLARSLTIADEGALMIRMCL